MAAAVAAAATKARGTADTAAATTSRFVAACEALSRYVKAAEAERARARPPPARPLPLMPGADVDAVRGDHEEPGGTVPARAQLTIVYGGRVLVLDDVPADRAAPLLQIAATAARGTTEAGGAEHVSAAADLPVARKASLQRFMEKRKGRLAARGEPYRRPGAGADACGGRDDLTLALAL